MGGPDSSSAITLDLHSHGAAVPVTTHTRTTAAEIRTSDRVCHRGTRALPPPALCISDDPLSDGGVDSPSARATRTLAPYRDPEMGLPFLGVRSSGSKHRPHGINSQCTIRVEQQHIQAGIEVPCVLPSSWIGPRWWT
ncbi:hypothetical protein ON010_g3137 [Phytophthora cinnamomi]|nr:hypothetical protein ON010_g3137 [Phytophthora cinnamomi]